MLVHVFLAFSGSAVALDFVLLTGKLVIVGQLLAREDLSCGKYDNMFLSENVDYFAVAVRLKS